ncbi:MAG TPA: choice-of-anchor A family protein [Chloroflexia bacterium]|nr:choice-of-anchor A family protein [Chloroflexia bacterium]
MKRQTGLKADSRSFSPRHNPILKIGKAGFTATSLVMLLAFSMFLALAAVWVQPAKAASPNLVISQVYGGGGNSGATLKNDFIELFNRGNTTVDLTGWSVQYASATGSSWTNKTVLSGTVAAGHYYLIQEAAGSGGTVDLPTPDATGAINLSGASGKVALVNNNTALTVSCPTDSSVVDFVGYGTANCFEGSSAAPGLSSSTADSRAGNGCTDTDSNSADFSAGDPTPRNSASAANQCSVSGQINPTATASASPETVVAGNTVLLTVQVTPGSNPPSTGLLVTADLSSIGGSATQQFYDNGTNGDTAAGDNNFSFLATVASGTSTGSKSLPYAVTDAQNRTANGAISLTVAVLTPIHDIQGNRHISPLRNQNVTTSGIVTALSSNGLYLETPTSQFDNDPATSEGVFVFLNSAPVVKAGDEIQVSGKVTEFTPGGTSTGNLSTTEISSNAKSVAVLAGNQPLPAPVIIGQGGRVPPTEVISGFTGNVNSESSLNLDYGLDFYESLEGMLVQVNNPVAVGPTNQYGELPVLADDGAGASIRTPRGGIIARSNDFNPERITLDDEILKLSSATTPVVNVGDHFSGPAVGVLDYNFGNFMLELTQAINGVSGGLTREVTTVAGENQLAIATFNVENLDPTDPQSKFDNLAGLIVNNLKSPDIVALEEIQDNNGATDDGVVDPATTMQILTDAIKAAGGPAYQYRQINPVNDKDGGEPGGNIRVVFMFRTDRNLSFIDRAAPAGTDLSTASVSVVTGNNGPELSFSPGRIDPTNPAFDTSRKPLVGEFKYNGNKLFVIANHFNSKGGDQPLFGANQPPVLSSEVQRLQQAQIVHDFVNQILSLDPEANIAVLGDLNDFQFSKPLYELECGTTTSCASPILHDLITTLPENERYTYDYEGNSESLDHILLSDNLFQQPFNYDVVHVNSEFADQASDHEPQVVKINLNKLAQAINFNQPAGNPVFVYPGTTTFTIGATASSGLPVSFTASGSCTLNGTTVTITGVGNCVITATQAGNEDYAAAQPVQRTFPVVPNPTGFNILALGNLNLTSSQVSGLVAAGGNATFQGTNLGKDNTAPDEVLVQGNVSFGNWGNQVRGNVVYGGELSSNNVTFKSGGFVQNSNVLPVTGLRTYVTGAATKWAGLAFNGTTDVKPWGQIILTGTDASQNVFSVNGSDLAQANSLVINAPAGSTVVINISGQNDRVQNLGIKLNGVDNQHVVYNFYEATSLKVQSVRVEGTIWAPLADVTFNGAQLRGTLVAGSLTDSSSSYQYNPFKGVLPAVS